LHIFSAHGDPLLDNAHDLLAAEIHKHESEISN